MTGYLRRKIRAAIVAVSRALRSVSGYPLALTDVQSIKALSVTGADGGVGDKTANLFDDNEALWVTGVLNASTGSYAPGEASYVTNVNYYAVPEDAAQLCISQDVKIYYGYRIAFYDSDKAFISYVDKIMSSGYGVVDIPDGAAYFRISKRSTNTATCTMVQEGSSASQYEPYGYKIPLLLSGGGEAQFKLYSSQVLGAEDILSADFEKKTAQVSGVDVSSLQAGEDFPQLWAGAVVIEAATAVAPSLMSAVYYTEVSDG